MKAALHRSITFWSGLLVISFICWAWRDSLKNMTLANSERFTVMHVLDGVTIHRLSAGRSTYLSARFLRFPNPGRPAHWSSMPPPTFIRPRDVSAEEERELRARFESKDGKPANPSPPLTREELIKWTLNTPPKNDWILFIPHWPLIVCTALLWTCMLFWRARRRARAAPEP